MRKSPATWSLPGWSSSRSTRNLFATAKFDDVTVRRFYTDYVPKGLVPTTQGHRGAHPRRERSGHQPARRFHRLRRQQDQRRGSHRSPTGLTISCTRTQAPEFFVIELFGANRPVVIPAAAVEEANQRVAKNYGIARLENLTRLTMPRAGIAVGSNLGDRLAHLRAALAGLREIARPANRS